MVATLAWTAFLLVAPALSQAPGSPQAPTRDQSQQTPSGTAVIRGRVIASDTGQPLARARVAIVSRALNGNGRSTMTSVDGRYEFTGLPEGDYSMLVGKTGYLPVQAQTARRVRVEEGQTVEDVDFSLPRTSVITGRVVDEVGDPVQDAHVSLQTYQADRGLRPTMVRPQGSTTNDLGEFRLFGLMPGEYYLSAAIPGGRIEPDADRTGYAQTYYPNAVVAELAERITLEAGQTIDNLLIALQPTTLVRISGTAVDSQGRPFLGRVMLEPSRHGNGVVSIGAIGGSVLADGTFSLAGVAPGSYRLRVWEMGSEEVGRTDLIVAGQDVTDVRVVGMKPITVSGRIVLDSIEARSFRPSMYRILLRAVPFEWMPNGLPFGSINDDLTFSVKTLPGTMRIQFVGAPGSEPLRANAAEETRFIPRAIRVGDSDIIDTGIEIAPNQNVEDVRIEITSRINRLSGAVSNGRGAAVQEYAVVIFASDRDRWTPESRYVRWSQPGPDGRYLVRGLPPGNYLAVALSDFDPEQLTDPAFLESAQGRSTRFTIGDAETKTLDLEIRNLER